MKVIEEGNTVEILKSCVKVEEGNNVEILLRCMKVAEEGNTVDIL
jgi:hypothetical protein